ncbi:hypothetical protein HK101_006259 [Irineochytrium annulatum]|nr:hypothetical protein HK101_006259 [Irineochytrium annulatum]
MKWFVEDLQKVLDGPFTKYISISISSGEILFTKLGNDYRSEIGLLGDVIVTAARLMPIAGFKQTIVIDQETHENVKLTHATQDLGMVHLKGRANDSRIYSIDLGEPGVGAGATSTARSQFGYKHEREVLIKRFASWHEDGRRAIVIVEAPSGLGKSTLATFLTAHASEHNVPACLTQGSEMDQWRPFSGLEPLLLFIFNNLPSIDVLVASPVLKFARNPNPSSSFSTLARLPSRTASLRRQTTVEKGNASLTGATLGSAAQAFLVKAGVDLGMTPLLGMVSTGLSIPETKLTENLDAQARINHVKSMVTKIVEMFVRDFRVVFVFDDAQWYDSHTLDVLMTLARYCPKMSKLSKLTVRVTGVDPVISAAIFAKTSGSPLFLQMTIDVIFVKVGGELIVDEEGVLTFRDDSVHMEAILTDLGSAVLFQYDRLDVIFQRVLKVASVLGLYFNLRNVLDLGDFDMDVSACVDLIKDSDIYNFLVCDPPISSTSPHEAPSNPGFDGVECSFRHISIMNAVYESMAFEERLAAHNSVGRMIESILGEDSYEAFLPNLEYHFTRAGDMEKTIRYKEELGLLLTRKSQWVEGIRIVESLVQYVAEANPEHLERLTAQITPLRKAMWFSRLCNGYTATRRYPKERDAGLLALSHLQTAPWPKDEKEMKLEAAGMKRRALLNWILTNGGQLRTRPSKRTFPESVPNKWHAKEQHIELEKMVLRSMTEVLSTDKAFTLDEKTYLVMRYFNLLMRNNNNPTEWTTILYRLAFTSISANPKLYGFFIRSADANDKGLNHPSYLYVKSVNKPFSAQYRECIPLLLKLHAFAKSRCDASIEHASVGLASAVAFHSGQFITVDEVLEPFYSASLTMKDDPVYGFTILYVLYRVALIRGDAEAVLKWSPAFEPRAATSRILNFGVGSTVTVIALVKITNADFGGALTSLEEFVEVYKKLPLGPDSIDAVLTIPHVILLMFDPVRSGLLKDLIVTPWEDDLLVRVQLVVTAMVDATKTLGVFRRHVFSFWTIEVFEIIAQLLEGHVKEAMRIAKKKLYSRRKAELEGLPVLKAMYHGLIAKYSSFEGDRKKSRGISYALFKELKCQLYLKWLDS